MNNRSCNLANRLNKQRLKAPECCDAFLKVNGTVLGTHRCVLAAASPYFHTLFYGAFRKNEQAEVDLSEILTSPAILKKIVDFFYGQKIYVTSDNISDLLAIADFLMIHEIKIICLQYLLENLTLENCLWVWSLANLYRLEQLDDICQDVALARFHDCLINVEDTLICPPGHIKNFLNKGLAMHCSTDEMNVFIEKYVEFDLNNRNEERVELQECAVRSRQKRYFTTEISDINEDKLADNPEDTVECLLFQNGLEFYIFSPFHNKWYLLCLYPNEKTRIHGVQLRVVGIGEDKNWILVEHLGSPGSNILYNICNSQVQPVPSLTAKDVDMEALKQSRYFRVKQIKFFCSVSHLYCLSEIYQEDSCVFLHKFDLETSSWRQVSLVEQSEEHIVDLDLLFHLNDMIYIFIVRRSFLGLHHFNGLTSEIKSLRPLNDKEQFCLSNFLNHNRDVSLEVHGSPTTLMVQLIGTKPSISQNAEYNLHLDIWETNLSVEQWRFYTKSHTKNEYYSIYQRHYVDSVVYFTATNLSDNTGARLATIPDLCEHFTVCRVPCELLKRLKPPAIRHKMTEPILAASQIPSIIFGYNQKNKELEDTESHMDENYYDEDVEELLGYLERHNLIDYSD